MTNQEKLIRDLKEIKYSIIQGGGRDGTDTVWMVDEDDETVCDRIDSVLMALGETYDDLEHETALAIDA